jgi:hypothetical protein
MTPFDEPTVDKKEAVFASFDEALVEVILEMKLTADEVVCFKVVGFPESMGVTEYKLTLKDKGGTELFPELKNFYQEEWVASSRSLEVLLAISFVRKARSEGFWLPS